MLFEAEIKESPSVFWFGIQQLLVPTASLAGASLTVKVVTLIPGLKTVTETGALMVLLSFITVMRVVRRNESGERIWILPSFVFILIAISSSWGASPWPVLRELFWPGKDPEEWWAFVLLTCPTFACIIYSAVTHFILSRQRGE